MIAFVLECAQLGVDPQEFEEGGDCIRRRLGPRRGLDRPRIGAAEQAVE